MSAPDRRQLIDRSRAKLSIRRQCDRTPMAVWREGVTNELANTAVDMTLRLDNADALPTCPQPQQKQQQPCAVCPRCLRPGSARC